LYLAASLVTTSLVRSGELSEPRGEYAVTTIPFALQNSSTSSDGHDLSR
jgi:hypothetical protein